MDWLCDPEADWPPISRHTTARILTDAESFILKMAHKLSEGEENPAELKNAADRLLVRHEAIESSKKQIPPLNGDTQMPRRIEANPKKRNA